MRFSFTPARGRVECKLRWYAYRSACAYGWAVRAIVTQEGTGETAVRTTVKHSHEKPMQRLSVHGWWRADKAKRCAPGSGHLLNSSFHTIHHTPHDRPHQEQCVPVSQVLRGECISPKQNKPPVTQVSKRVSHGLLRCSVESHGFKITQACKSEIRRAEIHM